MTRLTIDPAAAFEIGDAARSYETTRPGLGNEFIRQLDFAFYNIRQFPEMSAAVAPGFRRCVVHRFPFCLVYRVKQDEVQVLALFPTHADPERLLARLFAATAR